MKKIVLLSLMFLLVVFGCSTPNTGNQTTKGVYEAQTVNGIQEVTLSWGKFNYNPEKMIIKAGIPVKLTADTSRLQGCFRALEIPEAGVRKLFTPRDNTLEFTIKNKGDFPFSCSMGMGKGIISVV